MARKTIGNIKIEGLRELQAALKELPKATQTNVLKRALIAAAEPLVEAAKSFAPIREGRLQDHIVASARAINITGKAEFAAAMAAGLGKGMAVKALRAARRGGPGSKYEIYIGPTRDIFYSHFQEFGTVNHAAHPYMRPAWDGHKEEAIMTIRQHIEAEIARAAKRMAAKAARQIAKARRP
jgi:HK97 gp10 family phage protein